MFKDGSISVRIFKLNVMQLYLSLYLFDRLIQIHIIAHYINTLLHVL